MKKVSKYPAIALLIMLIISSYTYCLAIEDDADQSGYSQVITLTEIVDDNGVEKINVNGKNIKLSDNVQIYICSNGPFDKSTYQDHIGEKATVYISTDENGEEQVDTIKILCE